MTSEDRDSASIAALDDAEPRSSRSPGRVRRGRHRKRRPFWQEVLLLVLPALGLAILVKALFLQAFYIPSASMEPGLVQNDRILVQKPSYWFGGTPERGDVVVFADPGGWLAPTARAGTGNGLTQLLTKVGLYPSGGHLVKRVIGVAGDTITCCDAQGRISVNGHPLEERSYARLGGADCYGPFVGDCEWSVGPVPSGHVFVMGDNRNNSRDSTAHMCLQTETDCSKDPYVDVDDVVGKVAVLLWPGDRFTVLHRPGTFADVPDPA